MHKTLSLSNILTLPNIFARQQSPAYRQILNRRQVQLLSIPEQRRLRVAYVLIALNLAMVVVSILGVNFYAAQGYIIKDLQTKANSLQAENQKLEIRVAEAGSVLKTKDGLTAAGYVAAGGSNYIDYTQLSQR
jgi:hypothetical protein